jgi:hypothetical protein
VEQKSDVREARAALGRGAVPGFLSSSGAALSALAELLDERLELGRARRYVERLRSTLECIGYLYAWPERFTLEAAFTVDPTEPGFPGFRDVWLAEEDRAQAGEKLALIPAVEKIVESAVRDVRAGRFPLVWQRALVQRRYYERLLRTPLVGGFEVGTPRHGLPRAGRPHALEWCGLADEDTRFVVGMLDFTTDPQHVPPAQVDPSGDLYKTLRVGFRDPVPTLFDHLETLADVNPQQVIRLEVGPFHAPGATASAAVRALLESAPDAWLLECEIERIERAREPDAGPAPVITRVILCPPALAERLGTSDPEGRPARVFPAGAPR